MTSLPAQHSQSRRAWLVTAVQNASLRVNYLIASASLLVILLSLVLFWPVEYLGFNTDPHSNRVTSVDPGSVADRAGVKVGDRILELYERPIEEVVLSIRVVDAIGSRPVPIAVERGSQLLEFSLPRQSPSTLFQAKKLALTTLALICWSTGYFLGFVRQHTAIGSTLVVTFWLLMASVIGSLMFAQHVAYPVYAALLWLIIVVLAPLGVFVHLWFPPRLLDSTSTKRSAAYLLGAVLALNAGLFMWVACRGLSLVDLVDFLTLMAPLAVLGSLIGSGMVLWRGFHATHIAHIRRQIRLIMITCVAVTLSWIIALVLPVFVPAGFVHGTWLILLVGAVPLAYLIGGRSRDLHRLDRIANRGLVHLVVTTCLGVLLTLSSRVLELSATAAGLVVAAAFVAFYRPVHQIALRLLPAGTSARDWRALEQTSQGLSTTLDLSELTSMLLDGVRAQFGRPALAFLIADVNGTSDLTLVHHDRISDLPEMLPSGSLIRHLCVGEAVIDSRTLQREMARSNPSLTEQQVLLNPSVALWCSLHHANGHLLGLLLLGMRSDLDPYRSEDKHALRRLLESAALAFAHSAAYAKQLENEEEIRFLYQQLQEAQDSAAAELARWLHDKVINIFARQNVRSLKQLLRQAQDPRAEELIASTLGREQELIYLLRTISDQLHPMGIDDPLGLPIVLGMEIERQDQAWDGQCTLEVNGEPVAVASKVQHEALRIVREAITNAIKHAGASHIQVQLSYRQVGRGPICLMVSDDGCNAGPIAPKALHRGLRYMRESARIAGGELSIQVEPRRSTTIKFTFAAGTTDPASEE